MIPLFAFPADIRRVIYTTNAIESLNMTLRKVTTNHRIFPSDEAVFKVIQMRLDKSHKEHPGGYLVREAPEADVKALKVLAGHLKEGQFVTKFRKTFTRGEMDDDLEIVPAKLGQAEDHSEYDEVLPTSPP